MAKKIIEMVRAKRDELTLKGEQGDHKAAEDFAKLAVAAINDGVKSRAWETYMLQFVEKDSNDKPLDPAQLKRLLADDGSLDNYDLSRRRGYMLGNAVCGAGSPNTADLDKFVDTIDDGLPGGLNDPQNPVANPSGNASAESATPAAGAQGGPTAESPKP
jgi:hypothetical protein